MTAGARRFADEINEQHRLAREKFAEHAIECGKLLLVQKVRVGYGNFGKWIEANCVFSIATANNYMKVAKNPNALGKSGVIRRLYPSGFADDPKRITVERPTQGGTNKLPPKAEPAPRVVEGASPLLSGAPTTPAKENKKPYQKTDPETCWRWHDASAEMKALTRKLANKGRRERVYQVVLLMDLLGLYDDVIRKSLEQLEIPADERKAAS